MRKEIFLFIKQELEDLLGRNVLLTEPSWDNFVDYPAVYFDFGDEKVVRGINQQTVRELVLNLYIVDRCLKNDAETHYLNLLEAISLIDNYFVRNRVLQLGQKNITVYIERVVTQATKRLPDNYALVGAAIQLRVIYSLEV